jgi:transcriptional regulator with XRE-family HTH domain
MLGVSQIDLCAAARCGRNLLNDFENGRRVPRAANVRRLRLALEELGAVFLLVDGGTAVTVVRASAHGRTPRARGFVED